MNKPEPSSSIDHEPAPRPTTEVQLARGKLVPVAMAYAERHLRTLLNLGRHTLEVHPAARGSKSLVYFLRCDGSCRAVIYLYDDPREWKENCAALRLGKTHNLPMPRLIHARKPPPWRWSNGFPALATDFAEGGTLNHIEWTPPRVELLATTLKRLHALESPKWGPPGRPGGGPYRDSLRKSVTSRLRKIRRSPSAPPPCDINAIEAFFDREFSRLPEPRTFQLCHHHLAPDDLILSTDESRMTILDCATIEYSRAARDLASVHQAILTDSTAPWGEFLEAYFRGCPAPHRQRVESEIPLFSAFFLLVKLRNQVEGPRGAGYLQRLLTLCDSGATPA